MKTHGITYMIFQGSKEKFILRVRALRQPETYYSVKSGYYNEYCESKDFRRSQTWPVSLKENLSQNSVNHQKRVGLLLEPTSQWIP
jgi:hypothetical protein